MSNHRPTDKEIAQTWAEECRLRREQIAADKRRDDDMRGLTRESKPDLQGAPNA